MRVRVAILVAYVAVIFLFGGLFGAKHYYEGRIRQVEQEHSNQMQIVKVAQQRQLDRVWGKAIAQARAEAVSSEVREYHRGKYEACLMHYFTFGTALNCRRLVVKGYEVKAHEREPLKSWDVLWREVLGLESG